MAPQTVPTNKKSLHCYHCNKDGFKRSELTDNTYPAGAFLCSDCRAIPGAEGQLLAKYRGLRSGSPAYVAWAQPFNIIGADEVAPSPTDTEQPARDPKSHQREERPQTEFQKWRLSVYASSLAADVKLCLLCLAEWGDYDTGANIFPSEQAIADALGLTKWQVRRLLRLGRDWAVPLRTKRHKGSRGDSVNLYQLRRPADAKYGPWNGPSRCDPTWIAVKAPTASGVA